MEIAFPYGEKKIPIDIPEKNVLVVAKAKEKKAGNENEIIENALENPLHSRKLEQLHGRTVIVVDDKTRPLPVKKILPSSRGTMWRAASAVICSPLRSSAVKP